MERTLRLIVLSRYSAGGPLKMEQAACGDVEMVISEIEKTIVVTQLTRRIQLMLRSGRLQYHMRLVEISNSSNIDLQATKCLFEEQKVLSLESVIGNNLSTTYCIKNILKQISRDL